MWSLLIINIVMFIVTMASADWKFASFSENPTIGPSLDVFLDLGAKQRHAIVEEGEWWRLITAGFLHGGIIHLLLNMWVLARIGGPLEEVFGSIAFAAIYLISLVSGNLASSVFLPDVLGVGASGAIYGIIGAMFADLIQNWSIMPSDRWCYLVSLAFNTVLGLLIGLVPLLDNFSHIGGVLAGFFVGMFLLVLPRWHRSRQEWYWPLYAKLLGAVSLIILIVWLGVMFSILYSSVDGNDWCPSCRYLSCVDTPFWACPS
jgi:membrane associated rhomboid family serine protease